MIAHLFDRFEFGASTHRKHPLTSSDPTNPRSGASVRQRCVNAPETIPDQPLSNPVRQKVAFGASSSI